MPYQLMCLVIISYFVNSVASIDPNCTPNISNNATSHQKASMMITLLNNAKNLIEDAKKYAPGISCPFSETCDKPIDCAEIYEKDPSSTSSIQKIWPRSRIISGPINVYCDMDDDGGGWTVIQRRGDFDSSRDYFFKDWAAYKKGFGELLQDFWLGNDNIFALTNQRFNKVKFSLSDWEGNKTYATYEEFWIDDELHKYTVHVNGYRGTAGDSFSNANGAPFSTKDQDNDSNTDGSCAVSYSGAWWYTACHSSNLNGLYLKGAHESYANSVVWKAFRGYHYSLKDTIIKIRPTAFKSIKSHVTPQ